MNNEVIDVSVIIPTFNRSKLVTRAIYSVLNQKAYIPKEVIVLDDASTDDSISRLESLKKESVVPIVIYKSKENIGPSKLRNIGIEMANSHYIAFLDSDDVWTENKLCVFAEELRRNSEIAIWTHRFGYINEIEVIENKSEIIPFWKQLLKNHASCPCTIIRKDVDERFSEDMNYNEDHEFFARITYKHELVSNKSILTPLNRKVNQSGGLSDNIWKMRLGEMRSYIKACTYNRGLIPLLPFLLLFSALKHIRLILLRSV